MVKKTGDIYMTTIRPIVLLALAALLQPCAALSSAEVTGTWESTYNFGSFEETMIAEIQQIGNDIIGSYSVDAGSSGDDSRGIIFGTIDGGKIRAYYLATMSADGEDLITSITFTDGRLVNDDTIQGEFYYRDSDSSEQSGPYEAIKIRG
jgi:hypothetical protein